MPTDPPAHLSFLPWVRQGAASAITTVDTLESNQAAVADVSITLSVNREALPAVVVRLRGPADVVGIDAHQVVRTDPRRGTTDFESNCFPSIEFDRADFPWLFTPAHANADGQLRPWLCLVAVRKQEGVQIMSTVDSPLPTLQIAAPAKPSIELPDLNECWAWAHAQAAADTTSDPQNAVSKALNGAPELSLSRLVCPRLLMPGTEYIACVVPTFDLGRRAGLGQPIADSDLTGPNALAPAWTLSATAPLALQLPVFYSWEFRTGPAGDFESLAKNLRIFVPDGLGQRTVDIAHPGFKWTAPAHSPTTVKVEGALLPLTASSSPVRWSDAAAAPFEKALVDIVNQAGQKLVIAPAADPLLGPPLYGCWHAGRSTVTPLAPNWFDELNLDPRWRTAAAVGTRVIQQHQEALMASAWEQAAEAPQANQRLRQLQLSMAVGESLHARHLSALTEEMTLRIAAPVFSRIRVPSDKSPGGMQTLTAAMMKSSLPVAATRTAMRRLGRQRGPLTRRLATQGYRRDPDRNWVLCLKLGNSSPPAPPPAIAQATLAALPTANSVATAIWYSGFLVVAEGQPLGPPPVVDPLPPEWDYPGFFRAAAAEHLARIRPRVIPFIEARVTMRETLDFVRAQMHPRVALAKLARAVVATGDNVLQPTAPGVTPVGTETVMMTPSFPQPMYESIKEQSQELLLPGLATVLPETVIGLRTNQAFVEAYMIGLNFEMARELLWRGFPTDQQGTYFKHFWGNDTGPATPGDIDDLRKNPGRELGTPPANAPAAQFVLLLRSALLRRYPNALIYLTPALKAPSSAAKPDIFPIFNGAMEPEVNFVGFPLTPDKAIGSGDDPGYFVVIQEHPTEPRFGLDVGISTTLLNRANHLGIGTQNPAVPIDLHGCIWGKNSAHMAEITRRQPVRITIHASQLVAANWHTEKS